MFERFTNSARRVIFHARKEALEAGDQHIEPAHLTWGIIQEASRLFRELLPAERGFDELVEAFRSRRAGAPLGSVSDLPMCPDSLRAITRAVELAKDGWVTPELLLLGVLEADGPVCKTLKSFGNDTERVTEYLKAHPPVQGEFAAAGGADGFRAVLSRAGGHPVPALQDLYSSCLPGYRQNGEPRRNASF